MIRGKVESEDDMLTISRRGRWRWVAAGGLASASLLVSTTGATASALVPRTLPKNLAQFAHCPVNVKSVTLCLYSSMATTQFTLGSTTVSSTAPTTLSLGLVIASNGSDQVVEPTDGTSPLVAPEIPLPNGLLGIPGTGFGPLAVNTQAQLTGAPTLSLTNLLNQEGNAFTMPIDVLVTSAIGVLGSSCTIGSQTNPSLLRLTTGTTKPPAPNKPLSGSRGKLSTAPDEELIDSGIRLVNNSFAVGGANNCGPTSLLYPLVDGIINAQKGLPVPAGNNTVILTGTSYTVPASVIRKYIG
jgi:hypothetical protein